MEIDEKTVEFALTLLAVLLTSDTVIGLVPDRFISYIGLFRAILKRLKKNKDEKKGQ